jgi:hypothetical protein
MGLQQLRVRRQNPPAGSAPPQANRARDEATQRVASIWRAWDPNEGAQHAHVLYLSLGRVVSFMPLCVG